MAQAMAQDAHPTDAIHGTTAAIESLRAQIRRLAAFDTPGNPHVPTVLLLGETGTGKGLVARVMHDSGPRARAPFVDVNCAAIPEAMLEAELFGFEAGAFTDAKRAKPGLFEAASGGTLFLDEIDAMSAPVQSKVLKAIEEKRVRRLGAVEPRGADVKLVAATQADLPALVAAGAFRADLYHRLAVLVLTIPPLRERSGDAVALAEHYLATYAGAHGLAPKRLTASGRDWLAQYRWPGNVRELSHLMERVTLLGVDDEVSAASLSALANVPASGSPPPAATAAPSPSPEAGDSDDAARIRAALARAGGNVVRAARLLGIGRNALRYRMRRLGIDRPDIAPIDAGAGEPAADAAVAPARPPGADPAAAWEQKSVGVVAFSLAFPERDDAGLAYEPWTAAARWQRRMIERVEGFGGVFVERAPSRLTAVFGIPRALEQSTQRAVQAALAVQRALAPRAGAASADDPSLPAGMPAVRAAVHVGEVLLDPSAGNPAVQVFPIGDTFSLPERLLGHTGAGEVVLSAAVARRVERSFSLSARTVQLGPAVADRATVHAVQHPQPRFDAGVAADDPTVHFVGRERELAAVADAFARAASGQGQVVFVSGEAGIGKSRLLAELRGRLAAEPHTWIEGHCASYGTTTPFLPLIDGLRRALRIDDRDDDSSASAKIEAAVAQLGADLSWTLPYMKQLLSLDVGDAHVTALDSASRRSELSRALRALAERVAERVPLVFVVEDLHWIDPATEEWLLFFAEVVPTLRCLMIVSHRIGYRPPFPDRSFHVRVSLPPLTGGEMAAITGALLGGVAIPDELRALIAGKAEGNPFFVEELVRSLLEDGSLRRDGDRIVLATELDRLIVPDTVQDVLIARIDRLAEDSRRAIQVASVIGREFALRLLARITDAGERISGQVEELRNLELIYEKAMHPELAYMFKHALTHDVAYESVLVDRRKRLHNAIGRTIEELYADRLAEHYETLAHHFSRGEDWERALLYHERSAEKAAATHANRAVVHHCRQALAIADRLNADDDTRCRLHQRLARAGVNLSEFALAGASFERAATYATSAEARALHLGNASFNYIWAHRYEDALRTNAAAMAASADVPVGQALAKSVRGFYKAVHDADLDGYEQEVREALAICARHPHPVVDTFAHFQTVMLAEWSGDYANAIERAEHVIALGRRLQIPELIVLPTWFLGKARCCIGDFGGAIALVEDAYALCDRIGDRAWKSRMLNTIGWCYAEIGATGRGRDYNERAAALARDIGDPEILANADINLAMNHLAVGEVQRAVDLIEPIEAALARPGDPWMRWRYALHVRHARAQIALAEGAPDAALAAIEEELAAARRYRAPKVEARALILRGAALLGVEQREEAAASLRDGAAVAARVGHVRGTWQASAWLGEVARRAGDQGDAARHTAAARAIAERAAGSLTDAALRAGLIASAVRTVGR